LKAAATGKRKYIKSWLNPGSFHFYQHSFQTIRVKNQWRTQIASGYTARCSCSFDVFVVIAEVNKFPPKSTCKEGLGFSSSDEVNSKKFSSVGPSCPRTVSAFFRLLPPNLPVVLEKESSQ